VVRDAQDRLRALLGNRAIPSVSIILVRIFHDIVKVSGAVDAMVPQVGCDGISLPLFQEPDRKLVIIAPASFLFDREDCVDRMDPGF